MLPVKWTRDQDPLDLDKPRITEAEKRLFIDWLEYKEQHALRAIKTARISAKTAPGYKFENALQYWRDVHSAIKWLIYSLDKNHLRQRRG